MADPVFVSYDADGLIPVANIRMDVPYNVASHNARAAGDPIAKGTTTLVAGTKTISMANIASDSLVFTSMHTPAGTLGATYKTVIVAGTSLTITSVTTALATQILDTSVLHYAVFNP